MTNARIALIDHDCSSRLASGELDRADCVVTDASVAGRDGPELCERLAATKPALLIIVLTRQPGPAQLARILQAGAVAYVAKPVEWETLSEAIRAALRDRTNGQSNPQQQTASDPLSPPPQPIPS